MSPEPTASHAAGPAFRELFDAELPYVVRSLRRLGVPERDVPDLAQDVFVAVHQRFSEYDAERPARPWLFAFACRIASNYRKLARVRTERWDGGERLDRRTDGTDAEAQHERRALLLAALERVPFERRTVLVMHDLDGETAPVIAQALELKVNTVYARLRTARRELGSAVRALREEGS